MTKKISFPDMPDLDTNTIYWVVPAPGYGNLLNLTAIPEGTGKIFTEWLSWEKADRVGYTLFDKHKVKYWADAASIHMLSKAGLAGINHDYFYYTVFNEGHNVFKYGFIPKPFVERDQMLAFERFKAENQKLAVPGGYVEKPIRIEDEENTEEDLSATASAAGVPKEENDEEMDEDID